MSRYDFRKAVVGKTKDQVEQAVGEPDKTSDLSDLSFWYYNNKVKDPTTGNMDESVYILFKNGIAEEVNTG